MGNCCNGEKDLDTQLHEVDLTRKQQKKYQNMQNLHTIEEQSEPEHMMSGKMSGFNGLSGNNSQQFNQEDNLIYSNHRNTNTNFQDIQNNGNNYQIYDEQQQHSVDQSSDNIMNNDSAYNQYLQNYEQQQMQQNTNSKFSTSNHQQQQQYENENDNGNTNNDIEQQQQQQGGGGLQMGKLNLNLASIQRSPDQVEEPQHQRFNQNNNSNLNQKQYQNNNNNNSGQYNQQQYINNSNNNDFSYQQSQQNMTPLSTDRLQQEQYNNNLQQQQQQNQRT